MPLRVSLDGTPLLGPRTGVGRYVSGLLSGLVELSDDQRFELTVTAITVRRAAGLRAAVPERARVLHRPAPARAVHALWGRWDGPPVELLAGRCDVFHATNFVLPPSRRAAGVVTVHDLTYLRHRDTTTPAVQRYRTLVPRSVRRAALVLCPSRAVVDEVVEDLGIDRDRVRATPLGVDAAWASASPLSPAQRRSLRLPDRYLLFVGAQEPRKNLAALVDAHRAAQAQDHDVPPLVLVGPAGWGRPLDGAADVRRTGWLADDDLRSVVASAVALVLPSRYEGFGLPLLEALACGVPVVASDLPVHREVTGPHGLLVPVGDVDALASALIEVSTGAADPVAAGARRAWAQRFTWQACAEATALAYREAAG